MHDISKQKQVTVYTYMILQNEDKTVYKCSPIRTYIVPTQHLLNCSRKLIHVNYRTQFTKSNIVSLNSP